MRQPKLPLSDSLLYECANPECFYVGALMTMDDVTWKDVWDSHLQDLTLIAHCPSCSDPMIIWSDDDA